MNLHVENNTIPSRKYVYLNQNRLNRDCFWMIFFSRGGGVPTVLPGAGAVRVRDHEVSYDVEQPSYRQRRGVVVDVPQFLLLLRVEDRVGQAVRQDGVGPLLPVEPAQHGMRAKRPFLTILGFTVQKTIFSYGLRFQNDEFVGFTIFENFDLLHFRFFNFWVPPNFLQILFSNFRPICLQNCSEGINHSPKSIEIR